MYLTLDTIDEQRPVVLDNIDIEPLPNQSEYCPTSKHDRRGIQYVTFVNQVCKARIDEHFGEEFATEFDFKKLLGPFNLEHVLEKKLESSENNEALTLLAEAREKQIGNKPLSITGTWLSKMEVRKYALDEEADQDVLKRRRRQIESVYKRKWNHVAGVALCREFNLDFPYCGYKVVLHLSSGSIREMLRIMSMIWDELGSDVKQFLKQQPIPSAIQTRGILEAAKSRLGLIDSKNAIYESGVTLQRVCDRLGHLFSMCQSYPYILTTPETASIATRSKELEATASVVTSSKAIDATVEDIVRKGVVSGWLLRIKNADQTLIGLHPILAPKFGISFRNPFFYPEPVSFESLRKLFVGNDAEAEKIEKAILDERLARYGKRHKPTEGQMSFL
jgi:hypothetical protein